MPDGRVSLEKFRGEKKNKKEKILHLFPRTKHRTLSVVHVNPFTIIALMLKFDRVVEEMYHLVSSKQRKK